MKLIVFVLLALSVSAFGEDKSESKELNLPDFSGVQQPAKKSGDGLSFSAQSKCTTSDGQSFSAQDTGFATCVSNQRNQERRQ